MRPIHSLFLSVFLCACAHAQTDLPGPVRALPNSGAATPIASWNKTQTFSASVVAGDPLTNNATITALNSTWNFDRTLLITPLAGSGTRCLQVSSTGQLSAASSGCGSGGGGGGVSSVGLVGTANQVIVSGTSPITSSGTFTLSLPVNFPTLGSVTDGHCTQWSKVSSTLTLVDSGSTCSGGGGGGSVTSIATSSPITGGTITTSGTIACPTCVTSAASLTSTAIMTGAGSQGSQTPSATATLDSSGNLLTPGNIQLFSTSTNRLDLGSTTTVLDGIHLEYSGRKITLENTGAGGVTAVMSPGFFTQFAGNFKTFDYIANVASTGFPEFTLRTTGGTTWFDVNQSGASGFGQMTFYPFSTRGYTTSCLGADVSGNVTQTNGTCMVTNATNQTITSTHIFNNGLDLGTGAAILPVTNHSGSIGSSPSNFLAGMYSDQFITGAFASSDFIRMSYATGINYYSAASSILFNVNSAGQLYAKGSIQTDGNLQSTNMAFGGSGFRCVQSDVSGTLSIAAAACGSGGGGGVTSVTGTSPIVSSGGTTPAISCSTCITTSASFYHGTGQYDFSSASYMQIPVKSGGFGGGDCAAIYNPGTFIVDTSGNYLEVCIGLNRYRVAVVSF